jgi:hypothetical protein
MKKNIFSIVLMMLMVGSLLIFTTGCNSEDASAEFEARIAELEAENAALKAQLENMNTEAERKTQKAALQDWSLDAAAWTDGNGATVTFTATPVEYVEGQRAALSVRMGDLEAESTNCVWDGTAFTGSVELGAADGYSYYCVLTNLDGSQAEVELNSPENTTDEALVYLGSSLSEYANLVVEDWDADASSLNLRSGYIQVQMPRMAAGNSTAPITSAVLVLQLNSEEIGRKTVTLEAGEGNDSFEATLSGISFEIPAMEDDYQLNLWLEVALNSGKTISVIGGSWYQNNGELQLVVG